MPSFSAVREQMGFSRNCSNYDLQPAISGNGYSTQMKRPPLSHQHVSGQQGPRTIFQHHKKRTFQPNSNVPSLVAEFSAAVRAVCTSLTQSALQPPASSVIQHVTSAVSRWHAVRTPSLVHKSRVMSVSFTPESHPHNQTTGIAKSKYSYTHI